MISPCYCEKGCSFEDELKHGAQGDPDSAGSLGSIAKATKSFESCRMYARFIKERELEKVRAEINALRLIAPLFADDALHTSRDCT